MDQKELLELLRDLLYQFRHQEGEEPGRCDCMQEDADAGTCCAACKASIALDRNGMKERTKDYS